MTILLFCISNKTHIQVTQTVFYGSGSPQTGARSVFQGGGCQVTQVVDLKSEVGAATRQAPPI